jgi:hypothetical protein
VNRHARQIRLREVGEEGQARIARARPRVLATGLAGAVEARYLAGAGVEAVVVADEGAARAARAVDARVRVTVEAPAEGGAGAPAAAPLPFEVQDGAAREVAAGAWRALSAIRAAVFQGGASAGEGDGA